MAQIIVCCAQKGGCAKTVTVHNLSYALSRMGKRVLAVDFDTQANLTTCFGINDPDDVPVTIADLMDAQIKELDAPAKAEYIQHCNGVDLIASGSYLSAVSDSMHLEMGSENFLSSILSPLRNDYDYIIVDGYSGKRSRRNHDKGIGTLLPQSAHSNRDCFRKLRKEFASWNLTVSRIPLQKYLQKP